MGRACVRQDRELAALGWAQKVSPCSVLTGHCFRIGQARVKGVNIENFKELSAPKLPITYAPALYTE